MSSRDSAGYLYLTVTSHGGPLRTPQCLSVLLRQHPDVLAAELQDLLAQLAAALVAWLLHRVAQQHESPGQAEEQQQHAQLLRHVSAQKSAQHGTGPTDPQ